MTLRTVRIPALEAADVSAWTRAVYCTCHQHEEQRPGSSFFLFTDVVIPHNKQLCTDVHTQHLPWSHVQPTAPGENERGFKV